MITVNAFANGFGTWQARVTVDETSTLNTGDARKLAVIAITSELVARAPGTIPRPRVTLVAYHDASDHVGLLNKDNWLFAEK